MRVKCIFSSVAPFHACRPSIPSLTTARSAAMSPPITSPRSPNLSATISPSVATRAVSPRLTHRLTNSSARLSFPDPAVPYRHRNLDTGLRATTSDMYASKPGRILLAPGCFAAHRSIVYDSM